MRSRTANEGARNDTLTLLGEGLTAIVQAHRPGFHVTEAIGSRSAGHVRITNPGSLRWVAVLLRDDDIAEFAATLGAGAGAVISTRSTVPELLLALDVAEAGGPPFLSAPVALCIARSALERSATAEPPAPTPELPRLTQRESEVLELLAKGYSNREISEVLVVSVNTVRSHLQSLGMKLGGKTRSRIVANALAAGWVGTKFVNRRGDDSFGSASA